MSKNQIQVGDVVATRGYGSGVTVGVLMKDVVDDTIYLDEAYHLIRFTVSNGTNGGAMFDLSRPSGQKLTDGEICGGSPAIVTRCEVVTLIPDPTIWASIRKLANK